MVLFLYFIVQSSTFFIALFAMHIVSKRFTENHNVFFHASCFTVAFNKLELGNNIVYIFRLYEQSSS